MTGHLHATFLVWRPPQRPLLASSQHHSVNTSGPAASVASLFGPTKVQTCYPETSLQEPSLFWHNTQCKTAPPSGEIPPLSPARSFWSPSICQAAQAASPCHAAARCLSELLFSPTPTPECRGYSAQPVHDFSNVDSLDARLTWQPEASQPCSASSLAAGRFQVSTYGTEKPHTRTQGSSGQESDLIRNNGSRGAPVDGRAGEDPRASTVSPPPPSLTWKGGETSPEHRPLNKWE